MLVGREMGKNIEECHEIRVIENELIRLDNVFMVHMCIPKP